MGKQFHQNNNRGGGNSRGSGGFNRGGGNRGGFRQQDQGPPAFVIPYGTFVHRCENNFVVKCTDMARFPKFNRAIYLENKVKVGQVDQILGPVSGFYFSCKPAQGVNPSSFKPNQVLYINPEDLLQVDRISNKPKSSGPRGASGKPGQFGGKPQGGFGGRPQGGFGNRGGFGGKPQGGFGNRGGFGGKPNNFRR